MKLTLKSTLIFMFMATAPFALAKNLGVEGDIWPVKEKSLLKVMELKASELNTEEMARQWQGRARSYSDRPRALDLKRGEKRKTYRYTPVASVHKDILDRNGNMLVPVNQSINVLTLMPDYQPELIFLNADDKAQLRWAWMQAKKSRRSLRFILTGGSVSIAENILKSTVYFDQSGVICNRFSITQVPARVRREGNDLLIEEPVIRENGHEI